MRDYGEGGRQPVVRATSNTRRRCKCCEKMIRVNNVVNTCVRARVCLCARICFSERKRERVITQYYSVTPCGNSSFLFRGGEEGTKNIREVEKDKRIKLKEG